MTTSAKEIFNSPSWKIIQISFIYTKEFVYVYAEHKYGIKSGEMYTYEYINRLCSKTKGVTLRNYDKFKFEILQELKPQK